MIIGTLAAAGLPMVQSDNAGSIVAIQTLARDVGVGVFFRSPEDLRARLTDEDELCALRERMWAARERLTFDHHADALVAFLRRAPAGASSRAA